jgi:hypothetical protein
MSEETRKVRVKVYGMTQARIDYEPVVMDIPVEFADDDLINDYVASEINTSSLVEVGSELFDDKGIEFGYDVEFV